MKKIDEIIKKASLVDLLNGQVVYSDEIPSSANEMKEDMSGECSPLSLIKMRYLDGSIDKETHEQNIGKLGEFLPCKVYEELIFAEDFSEEKAKTVLENSELIDCLIELRLCLPKEAKEKDNALLYERYFKFTEVIFSLYCKSLRLRKPEKRLRTWAIEWFSHCDESSVSDIKEHDEEFFRICNARKNPEQKNNIFGIEQTEENDQEFHSTENRTDNINNTDTKDWLSAFFYRPKEG